jgi:hypothetical protein
MVEFTLVAPLLAVILVLTFFFGWAMMHKHQVVVADRYAAWRRIETGSWPGTDTINQACLGDKAYDVHLGGSAASRQTPRDLVDEVAAASLRGDELAQTLLVDRFPPGRRAHVSARFPAYYTMWEAVQGSRPAFHGRHSREGVTWRCDQARCWRTLRDQFYDDLDENLQAVPDPGDGMARMIRGLYLAHWPDKARTAR